MTESLTHAEKVHLLHRGPKLKHDPNVTEEVVTKQCLDYLARVAPAVWKNWNGRQFYGKKGVADLIGPLKTGRMLACELKRPGAKPDEDQIKFLETMKDSNALAFWTDSLEGLIEGLEEG